MVSPLFQRIALPVLAGSVLAVIGWPTEEPSLAADVPGLFDDSDGDFLPDELEWVAMTDPLSGDSDSDGDDDFLEVVQNGFPLDEEREVATPFDHEMRVLVTSRLDSSGQAMLWVHFLFRSMTGLNAEVENFTPWVDLKGDRYPLPGLFASAPIFWRSEERSGNGSLVLISMPVASEETGRNLLPFSFGVSATLDNRAVESSVYFMDVGGSTSTLAALEPGRSALQSLRREQPEGPFELPNKLCVLTLEIVGTSPQGYLVMVVDADCEDAQGLRCGVTCASSVETIFVLPDGMSTITGR